jgi:hypothetical protein
MEHLRKTYGQLFNFSHTYLMDPKRPAVPLLMDDVENFVAEFYYRNQGTTEGLALLSPCESIDQKKEEKEKWFEMSKK